MESSGETRKKFVISFFSVGIVPRRMREEKKQNEKASKEFINGQ